MWEHTKGGGKTASTYILGIWAGHNTAMHKDCNTGGLPFVNRLEIQAGLECCELKEEKNLGSAVCAHGRAHTPALHEQRAQALHHHQGRKLLHYTQGERFPIHVQPWLPEKAGRASRGNMWWTMAPRMNS